MYADGGSARLSTKAILVLVLVAVLMTVFGLVVATIAFFMYRKCRPIVGKSLTVMHSQYNHGELLWQSVVQVIMLYLSY